jgi:hypothetical protein
MKNLTEIEINGKMFPANLKVLFDMKSQKDYEVKDIYYLESENEIAGLFPAIIRDVEPTRIVLTTEKNLFLLKKVLDNLLLREIRVGKKQFYVHKKYPIGYSFNFTGNGTQSTLYQLLDEDEFKILIKEKSNPFKWSRNDLSKNPFFGFRVAIEKV